MNPETARTLRDVYARPERTPESMPRTSHPHGHVSQNVLEACPTCGGGKGGFIKTGRDPDADYHANWCGQAAKAIAATVRGNANDRAQHDADLYDDWTHGIQLGRIADAEHMTITAVWAAITRHQHRLHTTEKAT